MTGQIFFDQSTGRYFQEVPGPNAAPPQQGLVPMYGGPPAGVYPAQYPAQQQQQAQDLGTQAIAAILPAIMTLPTVSNATAVATAIQAKVKALTPPPAVPGNPTAVEHNALIAYAKDINSAVQEALGNDADAFAAIRQQVMFSVLMPSLANGGGGGQGMMVAMMLMLVFGGFV